MLAQARQERKAWAEEKKVNAERLETSGNCEDRAKRAPSDCQQELRAGQALRKAAEENNAKIGAKLHKLVSSREYRDGELDKLGSEVLDPRRKVEEEKQKQVESETEAVIEAVIEAPNRSMPARSLPRVHKR